jgi:hypothetical protein
MSEETKFDIDYSQLPERYQRTLQFYIENKIPPGSGMGAVLSSDLRGVIRHCDDDMILDLKKILVFLYNLAPYQCWGSTERVDKWLRG